MLALLQQIPPLPSKTVDLNCGPSGFLLVLQHGSLPETVVFELMQSPLQLQEDGGHILTRAPIADFRTPVLAIHALQSWDAY